MRWKPGKVSDIVLFFLTVFSLLLFILEERTLKPRKVKDFDPKFRASQLMAEGMKAIKEARLKLGIPIDPLNDPDSTGLIGHQVSPITYGIADLSAKLTSLNPNMAAFLVEMLEGMNVRSGDRVAVAISGSYPALNLALYSALKSLDIEPVIITQVSSDMWGANDPDLTWLDMENILREKGLFDYKTEAATIGGEDDMGRGLTMEGIELIKKAAERNNVDILLPQNGNIIEERLKVYGSQKIKAYIVIGESKAALSTVYLPPGILRRERLRNLEGEGVAIYFLKKGIPVLNFSNIKSLARRRGLPIAPHPLPEPGSGVLFYKSKYSTGVAITFAILLGVLLFLFIRFDLAEFLRKQRSGI